MCVQTRAHMTPPAKGNSPELTELEQNLLFCVWTSRRRGEGRAWRMLPRLSLIPGPPAASAAGRGHSSCERRFPERSRSPTPPPERARAPHAALAAPSPSAAPRLQSVRTVVLTDPMSRPHTQHRRSQRAERPRLAAEALSPQARNTDRASVPPTRTCAEGWQGPRTASRTE